MVLVTGQHLLRNGPEYFPLPGSEFLVSIRLAAALVFEFSRDFLRKSASNLLLISVSGPGFNLVCIWGVWNAGFALICVVWLWLMCWMAVKLDFIENFSQVRILP